MILAIRTILAGVVVCLCIVTPAITSVAQDQPAPERRAGSTVRGTLTYSDTGRPMRNASVNLLRSESGVWQMGGVTNGRGEFVFQKVEAGRYILFADAPGILMPVSIQQNMGPVTAQLRLNSKRDLFTEIVVNGTDNVDVKLQAVRGGVITGRVVTEDDQPVPNAEIKLFRRENDKWIPVTFASLASSDKELKKTDPSGVYRIAGLESGDYIVRVSEPVLAYDRAAHAEDAYSNGSMMVAYHPSALNIKGAQVVTVVEGSESTSIDVRMPERIPRRISGRVTFGPNDEPAGYVGVLIERVEEAGIESVMDATVRGDREGEWSLNGIPAGKYVVRFNGTARIGSTETGGHVYIAPKTFTVTVANEDVVLNARVDEGAAVYGTIKFDGPAPESLYTLDPGVVLAAEGSTQPPENRQRFGSGAYMRGYVREGGKFEIKELASGKYWFVMSEFQPDRYYVKSVTRRGVDLAQNPFKLETGARFGEVIVTLGSDMATIEGQVADLKPKPSLGDVVVMLAPANEATRRFSPGALTAQPDARGKFVFTCAPGEYFVAVFNRSQREKLTKPVTEDYFKQGSQNSQRVKLRGGEKLKGLTLPIGVN